MKNTAGLGTQPIPKLLREQAIPASIGILTISIYTIVDTIFVGRWVGTVGIAAITVVTPISFLISSVAMAIGVGGASVMSRALGRGDYRSASQTFGNQISLTFWLLGLFLGIGLWVEEAILGAFGAYGEVLEMARSYFRILLVGVPFLGWAMMSNNVIRALGEPRVAMFTLITPAVANVVLDPIFIIGFGMGIEGAAWATVLSYMASAGYTAWFLRSGRSPLRLSRADYLLKKEVVRDIFSIGFVTLARQGSISLLALVLNQTLYRYGGELGIAVYGIVNRLMMLANFPILGVAQGFLPIAGFNYGAAQFGRVRSVIRIAIRYGAGISVLVTGAIMAFPVHFAGTFTTDVDLIGACVPALQISFLAMPLVITQFICSSYYQAVGKPLPALFITLLKQGFFLIPLVWWLPKWWGLNGVWMAFPIADILSTLIAYWYLRKVVRVLRHREQNPLVC